MPSEVCYSGNRCENVDETQSHMQPVVVLERLNLTRVMEKYRIRLNTGESFFEVKTEADSNVITDHPHVDIASHLGTVPHIESSVKFEPRADRIYKSLPFEVQVESDSKHITQKPCLNKPRPYLCTVCDKQFTNKGNLMRHKRQHSEKNVYSCVQCGKRFTSKRYVIEHMNTHNSKYKCSQCGKCYRYKRNLDVHIRRHSGEKPFECTVCYKRFSSSGCLHVHSRIHSGEKTHKCHMCDKAFNGSGQRVRHLRIHTGEKPYKCPLCSRGFACSGHMLRHQRYVHSVHKQYRYVPKNRTTDHCPYCKMQLQTNIQMKEHVSVCTKAPRYSCKHCSQYFTRPQQLTRHLLKVHNEGTWFTCHICQKKFCMKADLKIHVRRHEGVKPYLCCECAKSFCTAGELRYHQMVHSNYRKFCCGKCGKYFRHKRDVVGHLNICSKN